MPLFYKKCISQKGFTMNPNIVCAVVDKLHSPAIIIEPISKRFIFVNSAFCDLCKYTKDELLEMTISDISSDFAERIVYENKLVKLVNRFHEYIIFGRGRPIPYATVDFKTSSWLSNLHKAKVIELAKKFYEVGKRGEIRYQSPKAPMIIVINDLEKFIALNGFADKQVNANISVDSVAFAHIFLSLFGGVDERANEKSRTKTKTNK